MDLRISEIQEKYKEDKIKFEKPSYKKLYKNYIEHQIAEEKLLIEYKSDRICLKDFKKIKESNIYDLHQKYFHDPEFMSDISCIVNSILGKDIEHPDKDLTKKIKNLKRRGAESVNGLAYKATLLEDEKEVLVVKHSNREDYDLIHEASVGILALNKLKSKVPNFSYIFGIHYCPLKNKTDSDWCPKKGKRFPYVIYENIEPSTTLYVYAKNKSVSEIMNVYLQVMLALNVANKSCNFTHYDLHTENVLMKELKSPVLVAYPYKNKKVYMKAETHIPMIIDYGHSYFKYDNRNFGYPQQSSTFWASGTNNTSKPLNDAYKLLASLGIQELNYFTKEDHEKFTLEMNNLYNLFPNIDRLVNKSLEDWIDLLNDKYNIFLYEPIPNYDIIDEGKYIYSK